MRSYRFGSSTSSLCTFLLTLGRVPAIQQASLRITIPLWSGEGFPEFPRSFIHSRLWKLHLIRVQFSVAVRTYEDALVDLGSDLFPRAGVTPRGDGEVLFGGVQMMELQRVGTAIIAANLAFAALMLDCK